jgi:hypothetical protein
VNYPEILLPHQSYPILKNEDVRENALTRETVKDVYQFLEKSGYEPDDILPFVIAPHPSLREVFELSAFLYGYYEDQHIGIRVEDATYYADWNKDLPELRAEDINFSRVEAYPLFLAAAKLDRQEIDFNGETHILSFSHKPTRVNYWPRKPELQATGNAFKITLPNRNGFRHEKINNKVSFTENEEKTIVLLDKQNEIVRKDVETALAVSQAIAVRLLRGLVDKGAIQVIGGGKNIRYRMGDIKDREAIKCIQRKPYEQEKAE